MRYYIPRGLLQNPDFGKNLLRSSQYVSDDSEAVERIKEHHSGKRKLDWLIVAGKRKLDCPEGVIRRKNGSPATPIGVEHL